VIIFAGSMREMVRSSYNVDRSEQSLFAPTPSMESQMPRRKQEHPCDYIAEAIEIADQVLAPGYTAVGKPENFGVALKPLPEPPCLGCKHYNPCIHVYPTWDRRRVKFCFAPRMRRDFRCYRSVRDQD
jgi:hypothetical protein